MADFIYKNYENKIPSDVLKQLIALNNLVFDSFEEELFRWNIENQPILLLNACFDCDNLVGYKLGYARSKIKFYSWMGGVHPEYRKHGIAKQLMLTQHDWCIEKDFENVQTETLNKWKHMLQFNIKYGFQIIGTAESRYGQKIILVKNLKD